MIKEAILKLAQRNDLTAQEALEVMNEIMDGKASPVQMSSYLTALSLKGETIEEITGSAKGMRDHCIRLLHEMDVLEIVGTGGDGANSFNISTTSALVIAAMLKKIGICFLFAQNYHIAMKYVAPIRKELGIRTVFNILGPLSNPAGANMELMGVYEETLVEPLARVMNNLGVKRGMVVYGMDQLDEISMSAPTKVCEIRDGSYRTYEICPEDFGFVRCRKEDLTGGTPRENAKITMEILNGKKGAKRDAVALNSGAALYLSGKVPTMKEGVRMAQELLDSGAARKKLDEFIQESGGLEKER